MDTWIVVCEIVFYPCDGRAETDVRESLQLLVQQVVQRVTKIHFLSMLIQPQSFG